MVLVAVQVVEITGEFFVSFLINPIFLLDLVFEISENYPHFIIENCTLM